jgi:hypothetical protein
MGSYFQKEIEKFLLLCKENKVDPIGLGDLVRSRSKEWNEQNFEEMYPILKTKVSIQFKIIQHGTGE